MDEKEYQEQIEIYRDALKQIVCNLEPLGYKCPSDVCAGCEFESQESLHIAMNVLAGLDINAHWGPPHTKAEAAACRVKKCEMCENHHPTRAERDAAFEAVGFVKDGKMWRRGTAF